MAMSNATFSAAATQRPPHPMGGTSGDGSVNGTAVRTTTAAGLSQLGKLQSSEHGRDVRQLSPSQSQMLQQTLDLIGPTPTDAQVGVIAANLGLEHHEVRCRPCGRVVRLPRSHHAQVRRWFQHARLSGNHSAQDPVPERPQARSSFEGTTALSRVVRGLEAAFAVNRNPPRATMERLAALLQIHASQVEQWFVQRRSEAELSAASVGGDMDDIPGPSSRRVSKNARRAGDTERSRPRAAAPASPPPSASRGEVGSTVAVSSRARAALEAAYSYQSQPAPDVLVQLAAMTDTPAVTISAWFKARNDRAASKQASASSPATSSSPRRRKRQRRSEGGGGEVAPASTSGARGHHMPPNAIATSAAHTVASMSHVAVPAQGMAMSSNPWYGGGGGAGMATAVGRAGVVGSLQGLPGQLAYQHSALATMFSPHQYTMHYAAPTPSFHPMYAGGSSAAAGLMAHHLPRQHGHALVGVPGSAPMHVTSAPPASTVRELARAATAEATGSAPALPVMPASRSLGQRAGGAAGAGNGHGRPTSPFASPSHAPTSRGTAGGVGTSGGKRSRTSVSVGKRSGKSPAGRARATSGASATISAAQERMRERDVEMAWRKRMATWTPQSKSELAEVGC